MVLPWADGLGQLLAVNLVMGFAGSASIPSATALTVIEGRQFKMGATMALFNLAMSLGLSFGPLAGGLIMDAAGLYAIFRFAAIMLLLGTGLFVWFASRREAGA